VASLLPQYGQLTGAFAVAGEVDEAALVEPLPICEIGVADFVSWGEAAGVTFGAGCA